MKSYKLQIAALLLLSGITACGTPADKDISKSEARALSLNLWEDDYCSTEGWYGDNVCDDFCPETDVDCNGETPECAPEDCGAMPAIAMQCPDGSAVGPTCGLLDDGTCGGVFECPEEPEPEICECDELPAIAMECPDGSSVGPSCGLLEDGTCGGVFECPEEPEECECDALPAIAMECPDGSYVGASCGVTDDGTCGSVFECPEEGGTSPGEPPVDPTDPTEPGEPGELCGECDAVIAIAVECDDGTFAEAVCRYMTEDSCDIVFECE